MACYLCVYKSKKRPRYPNPLHLDSSISRYLALGTCARCSVWACSEHGARRGRFRCAICEPAAAVETELGAGGADELGKGASIEVARVIGERTSTEQRDRAEEAISRIASAGGAAAGAGAGEAVAYEQADEREGNLVSDLAGVIRSRMERVGREAEFIAPAQNIEEGESPSVEGRELISIEAVSAEVARRFEDVELDAGGVSSSVVTGALVLAMSVADDPAPDLGLDAASAAVESVELKAPWEVSHPVLLDPVIWMLATAVPVYA
jgi:hypothetical protein